jgi:hypothetical protein
MLKERKRLFPDNRLADSTAKAAHNLDDRGTIDRPIDHRIYSVNRASLSFTIV